MNMFDCNLLKKILVSGLDLIELTGQSTVELAAALPRSCPGCVAHQSFIMDLIDSADLIK